MARRIFLLTYRRILVNCTEKGDGVSEEEVG